MTKLSKMILTALIALIILPSCNTDELCYSHPHEGAIEVRFDWSDAPEASPEGMRVWFYPSADAGRGFPLDLKPSGGIARVGEGVYDLLTYNNDCDSHTFVNTDAFGSHALTTDRCDILEPMYGPSMRSAGLRSEADEPVMASTDPIWTASLQQLDIRTGEVVTLRPKALHCHYTFEFRNVGPVDKIDKVSASISGMSGIVYLSSGELSRTPVTLAVEAHVGGRARGNSISGEFYTFGHHEDVTAPHRMALYVEFNTGQKVKFTTGDNLDVTRQIHSAPDPTDVHIIIDGISIPEPMEGGGGFGPSVDDWSTTEIEIKM